MAVIGGPTSRLRASPSTRVAPNSTKFAATVAPKLCALVDRAERQPITRRAHRHRQGLSTLLRTKERPLRPSDLTVSETARRIGVMDDPNTVHHRHSDRPGAG